MDVITVTATVVTAGLSAFLGAWLASRRYRAERLWDEKLKVYSAVFDAMNELAEGLDQLLDEATRPNYFITPEHRTTLTESAAAARTGLRRASRIGSFTISERSEAILRELVAELDRAIGEKTYFDSIDSSAAGIQRTLAELKKCARQDIKA
jgi:hypothetical protein